MPLLSLRRMSDGNKFEITHQKFLSNADEVLSEEDSEDSEDYEEMCAEIIETDYVTGLYVDEKYLIVLCLIHEMNGTCQRNVTVRCVDTFTILRRVSLAASGSLDSKSSDYKDGLFVTEYYDSRRDSTWIKYNYIHCLNFLNFTVIKLNPITSWNLL